MGVAGQGQGQDQGEAKRAATAAGSPCGWLLGLGKVWRAI